MLKRRSCLNNALQMTEKRRPDNIGEKLFQTDPKFILFARGARQDLGNLLPKLKPTEFKVTEKPAHLIRFRLAISAMLSAVISRFRVPSQEPLADSDLD